MTTNADSPAYPNLDGVAEGDGLTKRELLAAMMQIDADSDYPNTWQETCSIAGYNCTPDSQTDPMLRLKICDAFEARRKIMKAAALLSELEKGKA